MPVAPARAPIARGKRDGGHVDLVLRVGDLAQQVDQARPQRSGVLPPGVRPRVRHARRGSRLEQRHHVVRQVDRSGPDDRPRPLASRGGDERRDLERARASRSVEAARDEPGIDVGRLERPEPIRERAAVVEGHDLGHLPARRIRRAPRGARRTSRARPPRSPAERAAARCGTRCGSRRTAGRRADSSSRGSAAERSWSTSARRSSIGTPGRRLRGMRDEAPAPAHLADDACLGPGRPDVDEEGELGAHCLHRHRPSPIQSPSEEPDAVHQQHRAATGAGIRASHRCRRGGAIARHRLPSRGACPAACRAGTRRGRAR